MPAAEIEAEISRAVRAHLKLPHDLDDKDLIADHVKRIEAHAEEIVIELSDDEEAEGNTSHKLRAAWQKPPSRRRRELLLPASERPADTRPIRTETRAILIEAISRGGWMNSRTTRDQRPRPSRGAKAAARAK